jgi:hypothetical protein
MEGRDNTGGPGDGRIDSVGHGPTSRVRGASISGVWLREDWRYNEYSISCMIESSAVIVTTLPSRDSDVNQRR